MLTPLALRANPLQTACGAYLRYLLNRRPIAVLSNRAAGPGHHQHSSQFGHATLTATLTETGSSKHENKTAYNLDLRLKLKSG